MFLPRNPGTPPAGGSLLHVLSQWASLSLGSCTLQSRHWRPLSGSQSGTDKPDVPSWPLVLLFSIFHRPKPTLRPSEGEGHLGPSFTPRSSISPPQETRTFQKGLGAAEAYRVTHCSANTTLTVILLYFSPSARRWKGLSLNSALSIVWV